MESTITSITESWQTETEMSNVVKHKQMSAAPTTTETSTSIACCGGRIRRAKAATSVPKEAPASAADSWDDEVVISKDANLDEIVRKTVSYFADCGDITRSMLVNQLTLNIREEALARNLDSNPKKHHKKQRSAAKFYYSSSSNQEYHHKHKPKRQKHDHVQEVEKIFRDEAGKTQSVRFSVV